MSHMVCRLRLMVFGMVVAKLPWLSGKFARTFMDVNATASSRSADHELASRLASDGSMVFIGFFVPRQFFRWRVIVGFNVNRWILKRLEILICVGRARTVDFDLTFVVFRRRIRSRFEVGPIVVLVVLVHSIELQAHRSHNRSACFGRYFLVTGVAASGNADTE